MSKELIKPIGTISIVKQVCILSKEHNPTTRIKKIIAEMANINAKKEYMFAWQVKYKGSKTLKKNDILMSKTGLRFLVQKEENKTAVILCSSALSYEPNINVTLNIYRE